MVLSLPIITLTYLLLALFQTMGHFTLQGRLSLLYNLALCAVLLLAQDRLSLRGFAVVTSVGCAAVGHGASQHASGGVSVWPKAGLSTRGLWFLSAHKRDDHVCLLPVPAVLFGEHPVCNCRGRGDCNRLFLCRTVYEPLSTALIYSAGIVLFPNFSQKYAEMEEPAYREYVIRILKNTLLVMLPVSLLFGAFGTPVIRVLFEGGDFKYTQCSPKRRGVFDVHVGAGWFFDPGFAEQSLFCHGEALAPHRDGYSGLGDLRGLQGACCPFYAGVAAAAGLWDVGGLSAWWGALRISSLPGKGALPSPGNLCFAAAGFPWGFGAWLGRCTTCKWHPWIPKGGWLWFAAP